MTSEQVQIQSVYDDVAALKEQVALLQAQMASVQDAITSIESATEDTGWIDLPLVGNVQAYNDELKPKYRRIGKEVFLSGVLKNITAANIVLATLPEGFRPTRQQYFVGGSSTITSGEATFFNCQVNADGNIRITTHSTATYNANYYLRLNTSFTLN